MKRSLIIAASTFGLGVTGIMSAAAFGPLAAQSTGTPAVRVQTETFLVANMTCATCPITVKKVMQGVAGVRSVAVDFKKKKAMVVFDPKRTNAAAIAAASAKAGYPAKPVS